MNPVRPHPHIYEINLMTWLHSRAQGEKRPPALRDIPVTEWQTLKALGLDMIWLMGMWQRSPYSVWRARNEAGVAEECAKVLKDLRIDDISGSPYAVREYLPEACFGTAEELVALRETFEREGLRLILDFVPNHTACDHPWISLHPERYVHVKDDGTVCPEGFFRPEGAGEKVFIAHGRDPYFPPWTDTAQLDFLRPETVRATVETLSQTARFCHGMRCDMAMLVLREIFRETWKGYVTGDGDVQEMWAAARAALDARGHPFLLMAEAYWGKEEELLRLGFDCTYDKGFYDLLASGDVEGLKRHLGMPLGRQARQVRFLENHDEPRAIHVFERKRIRAAMVIHATVPGIRFWHHGQFEGRGVQVPVQLRREPEEPLDRDLQGFSHQLLREVNHPVFHEGDWEMCGTSGWPDNQSHRSFLAWTWRLGEERRLLVVNFTPSPAQGFIAFPHGWLPEGREVVCLDPLKQETFVRQGEDMRGAGLYAGLEPWDFHFFRMERT